MTFPLLGMLLMTYFVWYVMTYRKCPHYITNYPRLDGTPKNGLACDSYAY